jgi:hypothetical protein
MPDDPSERFTPFLDDPRAYVARQAPLDLERVGRRADGDAPVTVTARSLFLTRDVTVQVSPEPIYVTAEQGFRPPDWHVDTYFGGLGLEAAALAGWAEEPTPILDLASGLSLFATEAAALGLRVDCADAEFVDGHPMFAIAREAVARSYADQLHFLLYLSRHGAGPRWHLDAPAEALLERLADAAPRTAARYPEPSGRRFRDDATALATVPDDRYGVVLCPWLLVHLDEADERRVIEAAVRVTRAGGEVRVRAGTGGSLERRFRGWFPSGEASGKQVEVDGASHDDLLVLRVPG